MEFNFRRLRTTIASFIDPKNKVNKFNEAFLWGVGGGYTAYDQNNNSYVEYGYKINPIVYSVISQQATKTASIPYYIKKIENKGSLEKMRMLKKATNMDFSIPQLSKYVALKNETFAKDELPMPIEVPNPNQSWTEFFALYKTFLKLTGNVYIYMLAPEDGKDAGEPMAIYLLPSQDVRIVVKDNADLLGIESPVHGYVLTQGREYIEFEAENVIHIKYNNPEYGNNGEHLYVVSPLRAALLNIQSSNSALGLNIKTMKNGGAFGFIHGKNSMITVEQAAELKERLIEMNKSPEDLSKIAGVSAEMGFTRISLTSDELRPFDYWKFDQKQICNVLGWSDKLLNSDEGAKYNNVGEFRKQVVTDNIIPDLDLLEDALNKYWLPRYKKYQNTVISWDAMELPEMQIDVSSMAGWLTASLNSGVINRNEFRAAINYSTVENEDMDKYTVSGDVLLLEEALDPSFNIPETPGAMEIPIQNEDQKKWDMMIKRAKEKAEVK